MSRRMKLTDEYGSTNDRNKLWHRPKQIPDSMDIRRYTSVQQELYFPIKRNFK